MMWGIVPAAGRGSRIQPLAFSKELLPLGRAVRDCALRPCAVAEYLLERMLVGGVNKLCIVIGAGKSDIVEYFGGQFCDAPVAYVVQPSPSGLCDAIFRAAPLLGDDHECVAVGLPDTVWFPEHGITALPDDALSFLLFPVAHPERFDAVLLDRERVREIRVKQHDPGTRWIWGAFKMPTSVFRELHALWQTRNPRDEYLGTLINAWIAQGGRAIGVPAGESYLDVGTLDGYRAAMRLLARHRFTRAASNPSYARALP